MVELVSAVATPPAAFDEGDAQGKYIVADAAHRAKTKPMGYEEMRR